MMNGPPTFEQFRLVGSLCVICVLKGDTAALKFRRFRDKATETDDVERLATKKRKKHEVHCINLLLFLDEGESERACELCKVDVLGPVCSYGERI